MNAAEADLPPPPDLCGRQLPVTMATETPAPGRWRKRRLLLEPLASLQLLRGQQAQQTQWTRGRRLRQRRAVAGH